MRLNLLIFLLISILGATPAMAQDWRPARHDVERLCAEISDPAARSQLLHRHGVLGKSTSIDINHDGVEEEVRFEVQGTAHWGYFSAKDLIAGWAVPEGYQAEGWDDERWFRAAEVLQIDRTNFILQARDWYFRQPSVLYVIGPDNRARMLCRFSMREVSILAAADRTMARSCHAILATSRTEAIEAGDLGESDHPAHVFRSIGCCEPHATGALTADVFNSGNPVRLIRMRFDSGAGTGCGVLYYDLAADEARGDAAMAQMRRALLEAQGVRLEDYGFNPHCSGSSGVRQLVEFAGRVYILHRPTWTWETIVRRIYPGTDGLGTGGINETCRFVEDVMVDVAETFFDWLPE